MFQIEGSKTNQTPSYSFSGVKWSLWFLSNLLPRFLCRAAALKGFGKSQLQLSHTTHTSFHCMFPVQHPHYMLDIRTINLTCLKIQFANHNCSRVLILPWCCPITRSAGPISPHTLLVDTWAEGLIAGPNVKGLLRARRQPCTGRLLCTGFVHLISGCLTGKCSPSVNQHQCCHLLGAGDNSLLQHSYSCRQEQTVCCSAALISCTLQRLSVVLH